MSEIRIREVCGSKERETLKRLQDECFPDDTKERTTRGHWWIAYHGMEPVGFAGIRDIKGEPDVGIFTRAGVIKAYQGRGLQRRLIRARLRKARRLGWTTVLTSTYDNPISANNLITCGFRMYDPGYHWMCAGTLYWKYKNQHVHIS